MFFHQKQRRWFNLLVRDFTAEQVKYGGFTISDIMRPSFSYGQKLSSESEESLKIIRNKNIKKKRRENVKADKRKNEESEIGHDLGVENLTIF